MPKEIKFKERKGIHHRLSRLTIPKSWLRVRPPDRVTINLLQLNSNNNTARSFNSVLSSSPYSHVLRPSVVLQSREEERESWNATTRWFQSKCHVEPLKSAREFYNKQPSPFVKICIMLRVIASVCVCVSFGFTNVAVWRRVLLTKFFLTKVSTK